MDSSNEILLPSSAQMREEENKALHTLWRRNNAELIRILMAKKVPFFGLSGTSKPRLDAIEKDGGHMNIGTFYKRAAELKPEELLSALYMMASYTSRTLYTDKYNEGLGGLIIVGCGKEENQTCKWEPLTSTTEALLFDTKKEVALISDPKKNAWRSTMDISGKDDPRYQGTYICKPELYDTFKDIPDRDSFAKVVFQTRFRTQEIVQYCLNTLQE